MDLWESGLIYAPVSGPCRSVRAPGEAKSRMGTGAAAAPSAPASCYSRGGTGTGVVCPGEFSLLFKPSSGNVGIFALPLSAGLQQSMSARAPVPKRSDALLGADFLTWWRKRLSSCSQRCSPPPSHLLSHPKSR